MRTTLFTLTLLTCVLTLVGSIGCEEPTDPSLEPKFEEPAALPQQPAAPPTTSLAARSPADIRRDAERGDVPSMMLLGRSHESLGQAREARAWYQKAMAAGSEEGEQALAALDAPRAGATTATTGATTVAGGGEGSVSPEPTARRRPSTQPLPPGDPDKIRWIDITYLLDYEDMITKTGPAPSKDPSRPPRFLGVTTSRDNTITVAAMGDNDKELNEVSAVIRVRNKLEPGASSRVGQAGSLTALVTANNVNQREFVEWVSHYLQTEHKSEPIFRNGWSITVSGFKGERQVDPMPHLGTAVMIEMKK